MNVWYEAVEQMELLPAVFKLYDETSLAYYLLHIVVRADFIFLVAEMPARSHPLYILI